MLSLTLAVVLLAAPAKAPSRPAAHDSQKLLKLIERQTQISTLLTAGKLAYDAGDFQSAIAKWSELLIIDGLPNDLEKAVLPLIAEARAQGGGAAPVEQRTQREPEAPAKPVNVTVNGTVGGGGAQGPGGAVVTLRRLDGPTPRPQPQTKPLLQRDKQFSPHVLAVPVGTTVDFRNEDEIFHNVFSLSPAAKFDTGLHKAGESTPVRQKFDKPGVVELLCNIHATMLGFLVVVDTPWYAVADGSGAFQIRNVPPGEYEASIWHESANAPQTKKITVGDGAPLAFTVAADKRGNPYPPDKYGKPRQQQLGY